jgi:hypothetical protein
MTDQMAEVLEGPPKPKRQQRKRPAGAKPKKQPPYAVVVFNDELHTFDYVIETFRKVFGYPTKSAFLWPSISTTQGAPSSGPVRWKSPS